ncbi:MAG: hypothetical protein AAF292_16275 [Pseudomonadota bacterium]
MIDIGNHEMNLPWWVHPSEPGRVLDNTGVPVAFGSSTTTMIREDTGTREYETTDTAAGMRARIIVDAVNTAYGFETPEYSA